MSEKYILGRGPAEYTLASDYFEQKEPFQATLCELKDRLSALKLSLDMIIQSLERLQAMLAIEQPVTSKDTAITHCCKQIGLVSEQELHFAVGVEAEILIGPSGLLSTYHENVFPDAVEIEPTNPCQFPDIAQLPELAHKMLDELAPANKEEAARLADWRSQIASFGPSEWINFLCYYGHSTPSLARPSNPTPDTPHTELVAQSCNGKLLDFRFGKGLWGQGYYDSPADAPPLPPVTELRTLPHDSESIVGARERMLNRIAGAAALFGYKAYLWGEHVNVSAHTDEGPLFNGGNVKSHQLAVAGLSKTFQEGALPQVTQQLKFGHDRHCGVRDMPGRLEFRLSNPSIISTPKTIEWMVGGIKHGLSGIDPDEHTTISTCDLLDVERLPGYNKNLDKHIMNLRAALDEVTVDPRTNRLTRQIPHKEDLCFDYELLGYCSGQRPWFPDDLTQLAEMLLTTALKVDPEGKITLDETGLADFYDAVQRDPTAARQYKCAKLDRHPITKENVELTFEQFRVRGTRTVIRHEVSRA